MFNHLSYSQWFRCNMTRKKSHINKSEILNIGGMFSYPR